MANLELKSGWHDPSNTEDMNSFTNKLRKGDMVQMAYGGSLYLWAVCTSDGHQPKMAHRFGRTDWLMPVGSCYGKGSVHEIGLDEVCRGNDTEEKIICIGINNLRDKLAEPKPTEEIARCALEAVGMTGDGQFGKYHKECNNDFDFVVQVRYSEAELNKRLDSEFCSKWREPKQAELDLFHWEMKPGDLVEFERKLVFWYRHFAVVVDRPLCTVNHLPLVHRYGFTHGSRLEIFMDLVMKPVGKIDLSRIENVVKGSKFRINNGWDKIQDKDRNGKRVYTPMKSADIRDFAIRSIGSKALGSYNLLTNNCQHFAKQARYMINVPKNLELKTEWYTSAADIRQQLSAGDIIEFDTEHPEMAIYIDRDLSASGETPEVAYLSRSPGNQDKSVVQKTSAENFFADIAKNKGYRINNSGDHDWKPKDCKDIVKCALDSIEKEDSFFAIRARYGNGAVGQVRRTGKDGSEVLDAIKIHWYSGLIVYMTLRNNRMNNLRDIIAIFVFALFAVFLAM